MTPEQFYNSIAGKLAPCALGSVVPALFATALICTAWWDYTTARQFAGLRNECLIAIIIAAVGAIACLAALIQKFDMLVPPDRTEKESFDVKFMRFFIGCCISFCKWPILLLQLAATAAALAAAGLLIFHFNIPGT